MATTADRRPWGSLERAHIVDAAIELARREGIETLTIRRVATEVGASRMALYRHVPDKEALLGLVANAVAERHVIPAEALSGPWPERLRHLAHGMRRELRAYPGFAKLIMTRSNHGPGGLRIAETIADILATAGLDDESGARFYLIFVDLVLGRAHREAEVLAAAAASGGQRPGLRRRTGHGSSVRSAARRDKTRSCQCGPIPCPTVGRWSDTTPVPPSPA